MSHDGTSAEISTMNERELSVFKRFAGLRARYFPWRLYTKIYIYVLTLMIVTLVTAVAASTDGFQLKHFTERMIALILTFFVASIAGSAILAYRLTLPLRRVILKALRIASKKQREGLPDSDLEIFEDEPGEYYELEQALDKIRRKLKKRRIQLAHEREEAQALMSFLADAVFSLDQMEHVKYFNSKFATQFLDAEQVRSHGVGRDLKFTDVFRDPEIVEKLRSSLRDGSVHTLQRRLPTRLDSSGRYFSLSVSPLREEKGREIYGALAIFHDISEMKKAEKIRAEFVENASHELRTPLTSIKGFVTTAKEDAEKGIYDQVPAFLGTISKSVDRLTELVNDMLTISALENNPSLTKTEVRPEEVTEEVLERLAPMASEKKILIRANYNCDPFQADFKLVDQVLTNLIGNAIKYIPSGKHVIVDWSESRETDEVVLSVKDNGLGIDEKHLERLFERFYRIDKARARDAGGTGLGLSIVKHIMQSHGGSVSVVSSPGQGAEFICRFPV